VEDEIMRKRTSSGLPEHETALFRDAVRGTTPLASPSRIEPRGKAPPPVPIQSLLDGHDALVESLAGPVSSDQSIETGNEPSYLRSGLARDVLRKLRRGRWVVQDFVDLHGLNRQEARLSLAEFLGACLKRGLRCVRVVHGKGLRSPGREPVLKGKVQRWLAQRNEVLAFCEAPKNQGGSGALLLLLLKA
jgi:DNA-nicking Smr family endonuclease